MAKYYIPLQDNSDFIDSINGEAMEMPALELAESDTGFTLENDTCEYYPDLVWESEEEITEAVVNGIGVTVELIGGAHPPQRPR